MLKFNEYKPIQFEYKGTIIKGEYRFSDKDLFLSIETPDGCLHKEQHIPYACPRKYTDDESYTEKCAKDILSDFWDFYCSVLTHKDELINVLPQIEEKRAQLEKDKNIEKQAMQQLKKQLKEGTITNVEYQKAYTPHKNRLQDIEFEQQFAFKDAINDILADDILDIDAYETIILPILNHDNQ
ncbi:MAG: hypothetical protein J6X10_07045 [Bacteroidales bacterium]|nr:hypothetical protein [Bacteroidales bacterium]